MSIQVINKNRENKKQQRERPRRVPNKSWFQGRHEDAQQRTVQPWHHKQQLPSHKKDSARLHGHSRRLQGEQLRWKQL